MILCIRKAFVEKVDNNLKNFFLQLGSLEC
jgi:hypothetical protein